MVEATTKKQVKKMNKLTDVKISQARNLAVGLLIAFIVYKLYYVISGAPEAEDVQEAFLFVDWEQLLKDAPWTLLTMVSVSLMYRFLTEVACTDVLLTAVFDAADDELKAKHKGDVEEERFELLKDWQEICPPKEQDDDEEKKRKKKKKKDKKDKQERERVDYGEDSPEQIHPQPQDPRVLADTLEFHPGGVEAAPSSTPTDPRGGYFPTYH